MVDSKNDNTTPEFGACHKKILFNVHNFENLGDIRWMSEWVNPDFCQFEMD